VSFPTPLILLLPILLLPPPNKASKRLKIVLLLDAVPLLLSFENIWFRKETSDSLDGKKEDNGKLLNGEEDGDSREENGKSEGEGEGEGEEKEGEESIANGPNNSLNSERLKSLFEFLEKLSILVRPEIELSLFNRELPPMLKDG
jgi:hypothetical protein